MGVFVGAFCGVGVLLKSNDLVDLARWQRACSIRKTAGLQVALPDAYVELGSSIEYCLFRLDSNVLA